MTGRLMDHPQADLFDGSQSFSALQEAGFEVVATRQLAGLYLWVVATKRAIRRTNPKHQEALMELDGKRVILLTENMFNDLEFWYPYYRLKEAGADVTVVGSTATTFTGKAGTAVTADAGAEAVSVADFHGLVIPGGYAPDLMRRHPAMVALVRDCFLAGKPVAAICHAGWMLASAKILKGRRVTSFFAIRDDLVHAGAEWVDAEVVVDGNLVTSRTPDDLPAFMRALIAVMGQGGEPGNP